jgi:G patch domain-containing protein 1
MAAGFGLGALNDADDDDLDVYDDSRTRKNRHLAYDPSEVEADSKVSKHSQSHKSQVKAHGTNLDDRLITIKATGQTSGFFKNGIPLLRGFIITDTVTAQPQRYYPCTRLFTFKSNACQV